MGDAEVPLLSAMRASLRSHLLRMWDVISELSEDRIRRVVDRSEVVSLEHWAKLTRKGECQDSVYFLEEGSIITECGPEVQETTRPGSHFGAEAWQDPYAKACSTFVAGARSVLLRVPKTVLREVLLVPSLRRHSWGVCAM